MAGIHAVNVPLDMANRTTVDDKPENALQGHRKVKGQMSAFVGWGGGRKAMHASKPDNMRSNVIQASFLTYQTGW